MPYRHNEKTPGHEFHTLSKLSAPERIGGKKSKEDRDEKERQLHHAEPITRIVRMRVGRGVADL
jgi:hypothetical protein